MEITAIQRLQQVFPVVAILGARQCGKTTLAKCLKSDHYFDLENPADLQALNHPQLALEGLQGTIVIDEIQRKPDLFPLLRYLVDSVAEQRYIILGSASKSLIRQSSESLAGRIGYHHLGGLRLSEVDTDAMQTLWMRGGMPRSFLAPDQQSSQLWRDNYVTTLLERDLPQLGFRTPADTLRRFWQMLCHYHGNVINYAELAGVFGVRRI